MKIFSIFLVCLFILIIETTKAQQFYFGFRDGINFTSTEQNNSNHHDFNPWSFYGLIGVNAVKDFNMEFRAGYKFEITNNYAGPEFGLYVRPNIIANKLFLLGGLNAHINIPDNPSNNSRTIMLLGIGAGSNFSKAMVAELIFYIPFRKDYVSFNLPGSEPTLTNIIQLSLGINMGIMKK